MGWEGFVCHLYFETVNYNYSNLRFAAVFLQKKIMESVASFKGLTTAYLRLRAFLFGDWKDSSLVKS